MAAPKNDVPIEDRLVAWVEAVGAAAEKAAEANWAVARARITDRFVATTGRTRRKRFLIKAKARTRTTEQETELEIELVPVPPHPAGGEEQPCDRAES